MKQESRERSQLARARATAFLDFFHSGLDFFRMAALAAAMLARGTPAGRRGMKKNAAWRGRWCGSLKVSAARTDAELARRTRNR